MSRGRVALVPNATWLRHHVERGLTQKQMVELWEKESGIRVTRSAIAMAMQRAEIGSAKPRPRYEDMLPWRVTKEHRMATDARLLRMEARRRRGEKLSHRDLTWLTHWREELEAQNAVITYDPATEQGFWWVPKQEGDDDLIRRPKV